MAETHSIEIPGLGALEIVPSATKHNYYRPENYLSADFSLQVLGQQQQHAPFYFFEWQNILFNAVFNENEKFKPPFFLIINEGVKHRSKKISGIDILSAYFAFKNQVGQTIIKITDSRNQTIFKLSTEVFPQKMDYRSDYRMMMSEIADILQNLAYSLLKDTFQKARPRPEGHTTENEWWNILDRLFESLMLSLSVIKRQPKHEIIREDLVAPINRIKKASVKNKIWFQRNPKYISKEQGLLLPDGNRFTHALSTRKFTSYDTYENRFVVYAIRQTIHRLSSYKKEIEKQNNTGEYEFFINRINTYLGNLHSKLNDGFFNEVSEFEKRNYFSTTLTKGAGYRDFLQIYLLLSKGLEILQNDVFKIEQKDIATLYEYWCFLSLVKIIQQKNKLDLIYQDIIKISAGRFNVELKTGAQSSLKFKNNYSEEIEVYFNRKFSADNSSFTYDQKPDHAISFKKSGYANPFWFIFDAKYRFVEDQHATSFDAPDDAIGQLHRYRDAILHHFKDSQTYRTAIKNLGGIILYPYPLPESGYKTNKYYKSIEKVNIGALPFLPGKTRLVADYLDDLLNRKTPEQHFEDFIEMDYKEYRDKQHEFDEWITIGVIKKKHQKARLEYLRQNNIHYVPYVKETSTRIYSSKKVLICFSGAVEAEIRDIANIEVMNRTELSNTGITWSLNYNKYLVFFLKPSTQNIQIAPEIIPSNFRYTTTGALKIYLNNEQQNPKALYITNISAYRLFSELQRSNIQFKIKWGEKNDFNQIIFEVNGISIKSSYKFPFLNYEVGNQQMHLRVLLEKIKDTIIS